MLGPEAVGRLRANQQGRGHAETSRTRAASGLATAQARLATRFGPSLRERQARDKPPPDWPDFAPARSDNVPAIYTNTPLSSTRASS